MRPLYRSVEGAVWILVFTTNIGFVTKVMPTPLWGCYVSMLFSLLSLFAIDRFEKGGGRYLLVDQR